MNGMRRLPFPWMLACLCATGCAAHAPQSLTGASLSGQARPREWNTRVELHGRALTLHLSEPAGPRVEAPLVLYASGDGGWFGTAVTMFHTIGASGAPVVGFSTRAFLKIEQAAREPLTAAHVASTYRDILAAAIRALALPSDRQVVLTGWSRGASLAVLAAGRPEVAQTVTGVVAIGLPRDEQLDVAPGDDDLAPLATAAAAAGPVPVYALIAALAPRRCAVVQASGDQYLPASEARALFGPDADTRWFIEVKAKNHRFAGAEVAFEHALVDAVGWASGGPR
jgi:dienelactone hydrolase